jgi:cardiolipin synthase (CMP-forming)
MDEHEYYMITPAQLGPDLDSETPPRSRVLPFMSLTWLPNAISALRLLLGLAFPFFPDGWRLPVVLLAAFTDGIDGLLSRWLGADSRLGRILDPVADKAFFAMVAATLLLDGTLGLVELLIIGLRDWLVAVGALFAVFRDGADAWRRMPPRVLGKLATVGQFVFLAAVLLDWTTARPWLLLVAGSVSGLAGVDYILAYLRGGKPFGPGSENRADAAGAR